jgi:hypothetical protein
LPEPAADIAAVLLFLLPVPDLLAEVVENPSRESLVDIPDSDIVGGGFDPLISSSCSVKIAL